MGKKPAKPATDPDVSLIRLIGIRAGGPFDPGPDALDDRDRERIADAIAPVLPEPPSGDAVLRKLDGVCWPELRAMLLLECLIDCAAPALGAGWPHGADWPAVRAAGRCGMPQLAPETLRAVFTELKATEACACFLDPAQGHLDRWSFPVLRGGSVKLPAGGDDPPAARLDWTFGEVFERLAAAAGDGDEVVRWLLGQAR